MFAGCATIGPATDPPYYAPNPSAVLLQHKGDICATATASYGGETVTGAYALTPHLGLLASGSASLRKSGDPNGNQYLGDLGVGLFDTVGQNHVYNEVYGGLGWGGASAKISQYWDNLIDLERWPYEYLSGTETRNFWTAWMQGDGGYSNGNFAFMILFRVEYMNLCHDASTGTVKTYTSPNTYTTSDTSYFSRGVLWSYTPGLEARAGFGPIQIIGSYFAPIFIRQQNHPVTPLASVGLGYKF